MGMDSTVDMRVKATFIVVGNLLATLTIEWGGVTDIQTAKETQDIEVCMFLVLSVLINPFEEGIISTHIPSKWRCGRSIGTCTNAIRDELAMRTSLEFEADLSKDSIKVWSSLPTNYYCPENESDDFFTKNNCANDWDFTESPSSPKDAFRETCEFYGGPYLSREWLSSTNEFPGTQDSTSQSKKVKSSRHKPISRSKSLHNFEHSKARKEETITIGLSEQDLNRARCVLGLPTKGYFRDFLSQSIYRGPSRDLSGNYVNASGSQISSRPYASEMDLGYGSHSASRTESLNVSYHLDMNYMRK
jgi:hypothetical protein